VINAYIAAWASERLCVVRDKPEKGWQGTADLYASYAAWCQREGRPLMTNTYFTRRLGELDGLEIRRHARGRIVVGVADINHMPIGHRAPAFAPRSRQIEADAAPDQVLLEALQDVERLAHNGSLDALEAIAALATTTLDAIDPARAPMDQENDF